MDLCFYEIVPVEKEWLLTPTGALIVMNDGLFYIYLVTFFRYSLSPFMQLMLQVSL